MVYRIEENELTYIYHQKPTDTNATLAFIVLSIKMYPPKNNYINYDNLSGCACAMRKTI